MDFSPNEALYAGNAAYRRYVHAKRSGSTTAAPFDDFLVHEAQAYNLMPPPSAQSSPGQFHSSASSVPALPGASTPAPRINSSSTAASQSQSASQGVPPDSGNPSSSAVPDMSRALPFRQGLPNRKPVPGRKPLEGAAQPSYATGSQANALPSSAEAQRPKLLGGPEPQPAGGYTFPEGKAAGGPENARQSGSRSAGSRSNHPDVDPYFPEEMKLKRSAPLFNLAVVAASKVDYERFVVLLNAIIGRHTMDTVNTGESSFTESRQEALVALTAVQKFGLDILYTLPLSEDAEEDVIHLLFELHQEVPKMTDAQNLSLAAPPNWPINVSVFKTTPIPFEYNYDMYNQVTDYRLWVGERVLGTTEQATLEGFRTEVLSRAKQPRPLIPEIPQPLHVTYDSTIYYHNVRRMHERMNKIFQEENAAIGPLTSGWVKMPGVLGPKLEWELNGFFKLPEMHNGIYADVYPDTAKTRRFPQARNWLTLEEAVRFPLNLPRVNPVDFRSMTVPEMKFTDRFGMTMRGVEDTKPCARHGEHEVSHYRLFGMTTNSYY